MYQVLCSEFRRLFYVSFKLCHNFQDHGVKSVLTWNFEAVPSIYCAANAKSFRRVCCGWYPKGSLQSCISRIAGAQHIGKIISKGVLKRWAWDSLDSLKLLSFNVDDATSLHSDFQPVQQGQTTFLGTHIFLSLWRSLIMELANRVEWIYNDRGASKWGKQHGLDSALFFNSYCWGIFAS